MHQRDQIATMKIECRGEWPVPSLLAQVYPRRRRRLEQLWQPRDDGDDNIACARGILIEPAMPIAEIAAEARLGHDAGADLVRHEHDRAIQGGDRLAKAIDLEGKIQPREHRIRQPEGKAIDKYGAAWARMRPQRVDERERFFKGRPAFAALG